MGDNERWTTVKFSTGDLIRSITGNSLWVVLKNSHPDEFTVRCQRISDNPVVTRLARWDLELVTKAGEHSD